MFLDGFFHFGDAENDTGSIYFVLRTGFSSMLIFGSHTGIRFDPRTSDEMKGRLHIYALTIALCNA